MMTRARTLTILGLLLLAVRMASGQSYDAMRRSTNIIGSDLLAVQTNSAGSSGQKFLTTITASNFLESLKLFPGWSSGSGTLTTVKTNGANVSTAASSVNLVAGTNVVLRATNTAGAVTVEINSASGSGGSGDVTTAQLNTASNAVVSIAVANDTTTSNGVLTAAQSYANGVTNASIVRQTQLTAASNAIVSQIVANDTTTSNGTLTTVKGFVLTNIVVTPGTAPSSLSLANSNHYMFGRGPYPVTPSIIQTNRTAGTAYSGWMIGSKTNITFEGVYDGTLVDGSSAFGELAFLTNCYGITFKNFKFSGRFTNDYMQVPSANFGLWGLVMLSRCQKIRFEDCIFMNSQDHGVWDDASSSPNTAMTTNQVEFINCKFGPNIGSTRTNTSGGITRDGTAIVPTGGVAVNCKFDTVLRGIEPYTDQNAVNQIVYNFSAINCEFRNVVDFAIGPAGNTNIHFGKVIGCNAINDRTFTYQGTNYGFGGIPSGAIAFYIDGGRAWQMLNNYASGTFYIAFYGSGSQTPLDDCLWSGNLAHKIDRGDGLGYGYWFGTETDNAASASSIRRAMIINNGALLCSTAPFRVAAGRDITLDGNWTGNPNQVGGVVTSESHYWLGKAGNTVNILTNLTVINNIANDSWWGMSFGFAIEDNISGGTFSKNRLLNFIAAANGGITNRAGANMDFVDLNFRSATNINTSTLRTTNTATVGTLHVAGGTAASSLLRLDSGTNLAVVTIGSGIAFDGTTLSGTSSGTIGAGALAANANQFDTNGTLNIKTGALLTNVQARGITDLNATVSRAAAFNGSGNLTNATTTAAELDFVSGVTSAIQTQLNGKQNGQTNGNQFGASATITIASGALLTNVNARGVTIPIITADRAVGVNGSGNLTNSPNVTMAELEFLDGVTSAIQTQLDGKQAGLTNGNQFGATTTITIKSGALVTNIQARGVTDLNLTASRAVVLNASGNLTNATTTATEIDFLSGVTSGVQGQLAGKQAGSFILTNFVLMGITNIVSANANTVITTNSGVLTLTTASGGTGSTNPVALAAGSVYVTNSFQFEQEGMILRTTNMWADGGIGSLFTNVFAANLGGVTNILATNILDGQTITLWVWADTGVTVGFPQFAATNFVEGSSLNPATNAWSMVEISRQGTRTNINVTTPGLSLAAGSGVTFTTNFITRTLTIAATGSGGGATTNANQFGATADGQLTLKNGVMVTNLAVYGTNIALFPDQNTTTTALLLKSTTNNFFQGVIKNQSSGSSASSDWVAEADNGSDSTHYIDMGINGSGGGGTPFTTANHAYLYAIDDPMQIGSLGSGGSIGFYVTGGLTPVEKARIQTDGQFTVVSNIAAAGATFTNVVQSRSTNFIGTVALPNVATNRLLMTGGGSNVVAVTLGSGLQLTSGTLSSSLATNGNQFGATATLTLKPAAIITNQLDYIITANITGVGGANTNFTLLATNAETTINGFTNVSVRAVMSYVDGVSLYWTCLITNGSGSDRTLEFSAVTNRFRFAGTYGTNAPSVLTNATQLLISGRSLGTNTLIGYSYFAWP